MMRKVSTVAVGAVAYLLGAKAGRERYEQITDQARRLWHDPWVQAKASQAGGLVKDAGLVGKRQVQEASPTPERTMANLKRDVREVREGSHDHAR